MRRARAGAAPRRRASSSPATACTSHAAPLNGSRHCPPALPRSCEHTAMLYATTAPGPATAAPWTALHDTFLTEAASVHTGTCSCLRAFCNPAQESGLQSRLTRPLISSCARGTRPSPAGHTTHTAAGPAHLQRLKGQQQPSRAKKAPRGHARDQPGGHGARQPGLVQAQRQLRSCVRTSAVSATEIAPGSHP